MGGRADGWVVWWRTENSAISDQTELGLAGSEIGNITIFVFMHFSIISTLYVNKI